MKKILKEWGSGLGLYFDQSDIEYLNLKKGQTIDLSDIFIIRGEYKKLPKNQTSKQIKEVLK